MSQGCMNPNQIKSYNINFSFLSLLQNLLYLSFLLIINKLNVRTMPRASHRGTGKRRVNQVNEDSKLKSEVYEVRRLYVQREGER